MLVDFCRHSSELEKVGLTFSSFNPFPSLPSVSTDNERGNVSVLKYSLGPLFLNPVDAKTRDSFLDRWQLAGHSSFKMICASPAWLFSFLAFFLVFRY